MGFVVLAFGDPGCRGVSDYADLKCVRGGGNNLLFALSLERLFNLGGHGGRLRGLRGGG